MEIKPTYVTFKQAKLLKEKGFDEKVEGCYFDNQFNKITNGVRNSVYQSTRYISAPEQWQVVEWLRVNHGIWIEVHHIRTSSINRFHVIIWDYKNLEDYITIYHDGIGPGYKVWDTPQAAYSAAFDYILTKI